MATAPAPASIPDSTPVAPIQPGATIGIVGGGQLGRMLGFAARALGYRVAILDPDPECPAAAIADRQVVAAYTDVGAAHALATGCAVVTYELEHVGTDLVRALADRLPVRPGLVALMRTQDRLAERRFLAGLGAPTAPWREVHTLPELMTAAAELGYPLRLKAAVGGYDGRSQVRLTAAADLDDAWAALQPSAAVAGLLLERELDFACELSAIVARGADGAAVPFQVGRNLHDAGILVESVVPAPGPVTGAVATEAQALAASLAAELDLVGTLAVELFLLQDGLLVVNELAPRVHNSGHWTIEGAATSQFEQHIRAICGLPLGDASAHGPTAMVNLLGNGQARPAVLEGLDAALADPLVHVHIYDKRQVFEGRKMGHVTVVATNPEDALARARRARAALSWAGAIEPRNQE